MALYYYNKRKRKGKRGSTTWETNDLYYSLRNKGNLTGQEEDVLPVWLKNRKELIFPQNSIDKDKQLGSGQYGTVYKAKLMQGNAMYVMVDCYNI